MTTSDYILDIALVLLVLRQIRESPLTTRTILLPIGICALVGRHYLQSLPTAGNDLALIAGFTAVGVLLGTVSALRTRVRRGSDGQAYVKAGWIAAGAWVLGMGFRFGFALWTSHGGDADLTRFSLAHHITSAAAWTDALVLMAFGEVFVRTALLWLRSRNAGDGRVSEPELVSA